MKGWFNMKSEKIVMATERIFDTVEALQIKIPFLGMYKVKAMHKVKVFAEKEPEKTKEIVNYLINLLEWVRK